MARLLILAVVTLLSAWNIALAPAYAVAERRVALVIGNSNYKDPSLGLINPKNDASDVAAALKSLDFEVQLVTDVGKRDMDGVLERFARLASNADTALFYYAGHAIQFQGKNFLLPIDAQLEDEISIRYNTVAVDDARTALDRVSGVKIMILDACRNNPISTRLSNGGTSRGVSTRGLARIDKTQGMVIAYATAPDDVALDGNNTRNSPFASALIKEMKLPGLEIGTMFRRVASDVYDTTGGRQRPETSISLLNDYFLNQSDRKIWEDMRDTADIAQIREFLQQYPNSVSYPDARYRLDLLERAQREREDAAAQADRDARKKALQEEEERTRAEIARLQEQRRQLDADAAARETQRQQQEKANQAALEEQRKQDDLKLAQQVAQQKRQEQEALARQEQDRQRLEQEVAAKKDADQRKQAAERLAALEQQRVQEQQEAAKREAARQQEEEARRKTELACKNEQSNLDTNAADETKLKALTFTCSDVRARAQSVLASLQADRERMDRACDLEGQQIVVLSKSPGAKSRDTLLDLQKNVTCQRLAPQIAQAIVLANAAVKKETIKDAQLELRRLGCYSGPQSGDLSDATKNALKQANAARGKADADLDVNDDVLSDLKKLDAPVCTRAPDDDKPARKRPVADDDDDRPARPRNKVAKPAPDPAPTARANANAAPPQSKPSQAPANNTRINGISF
jgi:hypothetical protein